jgi:hypothetical protein
MRLRRPTSTALFSAALTLSVFLSGCGSDDEAPAPEVAGDSATAAAPTGGTEAEGTVLGTPDYVGLEDGNIAFHLQWVDGPIVKGATAGAASPTLESVRTAAGMLFDRVMFRFVGAELPGYEISWTSESTDGCSGRSQPPAGAKHLRVRLQPASSPSRVTPAVGTDLMNIQGVGQTCGGEGQLEYHVALRDSSQVRILELRAPPRLVVDVREPPRTIPTARP